MMTILKHGLWERKSKPKDMVHFKRKTVVCLGVSFGDIEPQRRVILAIVKTTA
jgi:hypothetical protein